MVPGMLSYFSAGIKMDTYAYAAAQKEGARIMRKILS